MGKSIYIIGLLLIGAFVSVNGLQCYVCVNCASVTDSDLQQCPMSTSTTTPVSTTPSGLTSETTPISTSVSGATTESTPNSTTVSGATSEPTPNSTTVNGATSEPTPNSTTISGTTSESTPNSTTVSGATSESTLIMSGSSDFVNIIAPKAERVRRHVLREVMDNKCNCDGMTCSCGEDTLWSRMGQFTDDDVKYVCIKGNYKDNNGTEIVARGCVLAEVGGQPICTISQQNNLTVSCSTCDEDKCNGAFTLQQSFSIILLLVSAALLTK